MTNFNYTTGIPIGSNFPAQDYANMATNFTNINGLLNIDHIPFNLDDGGMHKQIQFPSNNIPSDPTPPADYISTLFTFADAAGNPQLKFFTGNTDESKDQYLIQSSQGSILTFGGVILKWGQATIASSVPITFTKAFPQNIFQVYVSAYSTNGAYMTVNGASLSTAGFTAVRDGSGTGTMAWLSIGN